jgi:hypothetical protein
MSDSVGFIIILLHEALIQLITSETMLQDEIGCITMITHDLHGTLRFAPSNGYRSMQNFEGHYPAYLTTTSSSHCMRSFTGRHSPLFTDISSKSCTIHGPKLQYEVVGDGVQQGQGPALNRFGRAAHASIPKVFVFRFAAWLFCRRIDSF